MHRFLFHSQFSLILSCCLFAASSPFTLFSEEPSSNDFPEDWNLGFARTWHGVNGKSFKGFFIDTTHDGKLHFQDSTTNQQYRIPPESLAIKDLEWLKKAISYRDNPKKLIKAKAAQQAEFARTTRESFLPAPQLDRSAFPLIDTNEFSSDARHGLPSAIGQHLIWWDQTGFIPIKRGRELIDRAEWAYEAIAKACKIRDGSAGKMENAQSGIQTYFDRNLKEIAAYQSYEIQGAPPKMLAHYATGPNCVLLSISAIKEDSLSYITWANVSKADESGNVELIIKGNKMGAKLREVTSPLDIAGRFNSAHPERFYERSRKSYEIIWSNAGQLPDWIVSSQARFQILHGLNGLVVVVPYKYKDPTQAGKTPPPYPKSTEAKPAKPTP